MLQRLAITVALMLFQLNKLDWNYENMFSTKLLMWVGLQHNLVT